MGKEEQYKDLIIEVKKVPWRELLPFQPETLKKTNPDRMRKLKTSLKNNGFAMSFYVFEKNNFIYILDGHHRLKALQELEAEGATIPDEYPCTFLDVKNDKHAKKLVLAFNSHYAEIEKEGLVDFISDLDFGDIESEFEFFDLGFEMPAQDQEDAEEDIPPEPPEDPVSKLGDLYELKSGEIIHRVLCGDSTEKDQVDRLMDGKKADMVFTDPPYNVAFNGRSGKFDIIENDDLPEDQFNEFIMKFISLLKSLKINTYYICCNWKFYGILQLELKPKSCIVWAKNTFGLGKGYRHQHEFILFDGLIDPEIKNESDLWNIAKDSNYQHPTQKPFKLAARAIKNSSKKENIILDFFAGSGSTLIACEQTSRNCYGMEIDPQYVDVIVQRYANYKKDKSDQFTITRNGEDVTAEFV